MMLTDSESFLLYQLKQNNKQKIIVIIIVIDIKCNHKNTEQNNENKMIKINGCMCCNKKTKQNKTKQNRKDIKYIKIIDNVNTNKHNICDQ